MARRVLVLLLVWLGIDGGNPYRRRWRIEQAGGDLSIGNKTAQDVNSSRGCPDSDDPECNSQREVSVQNADILKNFQQTSGWCYAAAATAMNRYYRGAGPTRQCDMASRLCRSQQIHVDCCTGITYTRSGIGVTPREDDRLVQTPDDHFVYTNRPSCCSEYGFFNPYTHTRDLRPQAFGERHGKTWDEVKAAIQANQPFIIASSRHFWVCWGYREYRYREGEILCFDPYYQGGLHGQPMVITHEEYLNDFEKWHFQGLAEWN